LPWRRLADAVEGANKLWSQFIQLASVGIGETRECLLSSCGEPENDETMVGIGLQALDEASLGAALAEFNDAVMAEAETLGNPGDGGLDALRGSGDLEHELMLLGLKVGLKSGLFAEIEELTKGIAEFSEGLETLAGLRIRLRFRGCGGHRYIVSRCI